MPKLVLLYGGIGGALFFAIATIAPFMSGDARNAAYYRSEGVVWDVALAGLVAGALFGYIVHLKGE